MGIDQLYTEIIMQHSRMSDHKYEQEDPDIKERGYNPSCGDDLTIEARLKDGKIEEASFTGIGCSISQASASMLCQLVEGKTVEEAQELIDDFIDLVHGEEIPEEREDELGDAVALKGVSTMPSRAKCALLAWRTLDKMIDEEEEKEVEEDKKE